MTKVYVVRHCETMGNSKKVFQGSCDLPVTEIGEKQLACLGERFKEIYLDKIFVSPQLRAQKTALAIAHPKGMEVITQTDLREIDGGVIEGLTMGEIFEKYRSLEDTWNDSPQDFSPQNGESMRQVYNRVSALIKKLVSENKGQTFAIVSHGAAIRNLICYLTKGDVEKLNDVPWCNNTAVSLFEIDENKVNTVFFNNTDHLSDDLLPDYSKIVSYKGE